MTAHKHAAMIKAKADNMDLVVFSKYKKEWQEISRADDDACSFYGDCKYFLCLPKHKDVVLHILNGGDGEVNYGEFWQDCNVGQPIKWNSRWWCMNEDCESRIKPKKEKRWIAVDPSTTQCTRHYSTKESCFNSEFSGCEGNASGWQFIEIEVEI